MHLLTYNVQVTVVASIILLLGCYFLLRIASKIADKFRSSILYLMFAFIANTVVGVLHTTLFMNADPESLVVLSIPFLHFITAVFLLIGARKFYLVLEAS